MEPDIIEIAQRGDRLTPVEEIWRMDKGYVSPTRGNGKANYQTRRNRRANARTQKPSPSESTP
jgi:hypothetical protein